MILPHRAFLFHCVITWTLAKATPLVAIQGVSTVHPNTTLSIEESSLPEVNKLNVNPTSSINLGQKNSSKTDVGIVDLKTKSVQKSYNEHKYEELPTPLSQKKTDDVKGYTKNDGTYIIEDTSGTPCVMAYFKAKITVRYPVNKTQEKYQTTLVSPPDKVPVSGSCDRSKETAVLDLTWEHGVFSLHFAFDTLIDSWYVGQFTFKFDTRSSAYKGAEKEETVLLKSLAKKRFWTTSHARSFRCLLLHDVSLLDEKDSYSATIHFDEARVQALTKTDTFKTPKHCIHRVHRNENVPIFVGGSLAAATLLTVTAYAAFRYFKVKKFQYGTME